MISKIVCDWLESRVYPCLGCLVLPLPLVHQPTVLIVPPVLEHTLTLRHYIGEDNHQMQLCTSSRLKTSLNWKSASYRQLGLLALSADYSLLHIQLLAIQGFLAVSDYCHCRVRYWHCWIISIVGLLALSGYWHCRVIGIVGLLALSDYWHCQIIGIVGLLILQSIFSTIYMPPANQWVSCYNGYKKKTKKYA